MIIFASLYKLADTRGNLVRHLSKEASCRVYSAVGLVPAVCYVDVDPVPTGTGYALSALSRFFL